MPSRTPLSSRSRRLVLLLAAAVLAVLALVPAETRADLEDCRHLNYYDANGNLIGQSGSCCFDCSYRCRWGRSSLDHWSEESGCLTCCSSTP